MAKYLLTRQDYLCTPESFMQLGERGKLKIGMASSKMNKV